MNVLLAEDSPDLAEMMKEQLDSAGYNVAVVVNGQEVLDFSALASIDAIIMDIQMPVMDGLEATKKLRERGIRIPILAYTGLYDIADKVFEAGCSSYFHKPVDFVALVSALARVSPQRTNDKLLSEPFPSHASE